MHVFAFVYCACVAVASPMADFHGPSVGFLASLSRERTPYSWTGGREGEYDRETQSLMVWLNLHKSSVDTKLWRKGMGYENHGSHKLGEGISA